MQNDEIRADADTRRGPYLVSAQLSPLPRHIFFVHPDQGKWDDIFANGAAPDPDRIYSRFKKSTTYG